ncbi:MAG: glycosyltransferase family 2 protein [Ruthenibacterium sp.]
MPKTTQTKVSACIVTYGGFDEAATAATSILANSKNVDLQLYLVDNASPDGCGKQLADANFGANCRVICLPQNVGFGKGHNQVLPLLDSKYHAVINPDIVFDADVLSALCTWLDAHPNAVMATPRLLFPDGTEQFTAKRRPSFMALLSRQVPLPLFKKIEQHYLMQDEDLTIPREIDFCTGCCFVMRTDVFRKMGGFDESYFMYVEDADITREAQKYGKIYYVPTVSVYHAWHRDANRKWKNFWMQISSMFHYWHKWGFQFR